MKPMKIKYNGIELSFLYYGDIKISYLFRHLADLYYNMLHTNAECQ